MTITVLMPDGAHFTSIKNKPIARSLLHCKDVDVEGYTNVWFLPESRYWAFGSGQGDLKIYSVRYKSRTVLESSSIYSHRHHTQVITMLKEIPSSDLVCSCSLDGTVKLIMLNSMRVCEFDDVHDRKSSVIDAKNKKGYLGFDFSNEFGRYVLLYGFNNHISVYCLDISLTKGYIGRYSEHTVSITRACFVSGYPYAISMDEKCCIRIWNFRTFKTNQMINADRMFNCYS